MPDPSDLELTEEHAGPRPFFLRNEGSFSSRSLSTNSLTSRNENLSSAGSQTRRPLLRWSWTHCLAAAILCIFVFIFLYRRIWGAKKQANPEKDPTPFQLPPPQHSSGAKQTRLVPEDFEFTAVQWLTGARLGNVAGVRFRVLQPGHSSLQEACASRGSSTGSHEEQVLSFCQSLLRAHELAFGVEVAEGLGLHLPAPVFTLQELPAQQELLSLKHSHPATFAAGQRLRSADDTRWLHARSGLLVAEAWPHGVPPHFLPHGSSAAVASAEQPRPGLPGPRQLPPAPQEPQDWDLWLPAVGAVQVSRRALRSLFGAAAAKKATAEKLLLQRLVDGREPLVVSGQDSLASGKDSLALGQDSLASGKDSLALGKDSLPVPGQPAGLAMEAAAQVLNLLQLLKGRSIVTILDWDVDQLLTPSERRQVLKRSLERLPWPQDQLRLVDELAATLANGQEVVDEAEPFEAAKRIGPRFILSCLLMAEEYAFSQDGWPPLDQLREQVPMMVDPGRFGHPESGQSLLEKLQKSELKIQILGSADLKAALWDHAAALFPSLMNRSSKQEPRTPSLLYNTWRKILALQVES